jgi:hypothetical protein
LVLSEFESMLMQENLGAGASPLEPGEDETTADPPGFIDSSPKAADGAEASSAAEAPPDANGEELAVPRPETAEPEEPPLPPPALAPGASSEEPAGTTGNLTNTGQQSQLSATGGSLPPSATTMSFKERLDMTSDSLQRTIERLPDMPDLIPVWRCPNPWEKMALFPGLYCEKLAGFPWAFPIFYGIVIVGLIAVLWQPIQVNGDLSTYRRVAKNATIYHDVYLEALKHTRPVKNESSIGDRTTFQLEIYYKHKESGDVFSEAALRDIQTFEKKLRDLGGWKRLCSQSEAEARSRCEPGESLGNYIWPTRPSENDLFLSPNGFFELAFEGTARERLPIDATLTYLSEGSSAPHDPYKFLPQSFSGPGGTSGVLRSLFTFTSPSLSDDGFRTDYETFVEEELYPALVEAVKESRKEVDEKSWTYR